MKIERLWREMEQEIDAGPKNAGWVTRHALSDPGHPLLVGLERASRSRALFMQARSDALPARREWPVCRGVELQMMSVADRPHLALRLRQSELAEVFTALAEDVAPRIAISTNDVDAVATLFGRLQQWQLFMTAVHDGLSIGEQRGLFGELHVLATLLVPRIGVRRSLEAWKATERAHQDFQFAAGAVEVKTTAAKQPQTVRISSERQLDGTGVGALFLHVVIVDDREVSAGDSGSGHTLAECVTAARALAAGDPVAYALLDERLLRGRWLDAHADRYAGRRLTIRREHSFLVRDGFPRIVESSLPRGVGDVAYRVDLASCTSFEVASADMLLAVSASIA